MTWKRSVLVVANVTATSGELSEQLKEHTQGGPATFTLIVPATPFGGGHETAAKNLDMALDQLRKAGLEVEGSVAHPDPIVAVTDAWDPKRYDEIVVSTLPMRFSKWLRLGLPERIGKLTGAPVTHIVSRPPKPALEAMPAPAHEESGLGPLTVLGWGPHHKEE